MELIEIKEYLRIDIDDEDFLLLRLKEAAQEYLKSAGVPNNYSKPTYRLVVLMIIAQWYERGCVDYTDIPLGITCLINQLQLQSGV